MDMGKPRPSVPAPAMRRPSSNATAKRARTAGNDGGRDWTDLGDGPASLVAERVLAGDVVNYIWFRSVCRAWRRCCDDPRTRGGGALDDPRLRPRNWIMLLNWVGEMPIAAAAARHYCRRTFLNVSTGQCIHVDIRDLMDHGILRSTAADGLLFLRCKSNYHVIRLLNPVTRQKAELPPLATVGSKYYGCFNILSANNKIGLADNRTVWLNLSSTRDVTANAMAFAKPGDERWTLLELNSFTGHPLSPNVFFAGRFYGAADRAIVTVDMTNQHEPRLVVAATMDLQRNTWHERTVHLVADNDGGGKLMLVHRTFHRGAWSRDLKRMYKVYRVDLGAGKVTTRGGVGLSLRGRAVFIGHRHAVSVCARAFPSIDGNTVYPGLSLDERGGRRQVGAYHIRDGHTDSFGYDESLKVLPRPWTIADCLAAYVSAYDDA